MNTKFATTALIIASGLIAASPSFATTTREQINAELTQAVRVGDVLENGDRDRMLNQLFPSRYDAKSTQSSVTREQVQAELARAVRAGEVFENGDRGRKLNELYPDRYPSKQASAGLTPEQVQAELARAVRDGDLMVSERGFTCKEMHPDMHPAS